MLSQPPLSPLFPYTTLFRSTYLSPLTELQATCGTTRIAASRGALLHDVSSIQAVFAEAGPSPGISTSRSEEHTSELQSQSNLVCRLLLEKKKKIDSDISR